jgi:ribose transport system permease protein
VTTLQERKRVEPRVRMRRLARRHGWAAAAWVLLLAMVIWYATLVEEFDAFEINFFLKNSVPAVYMALAQASVAISGGVDLGVGAMMVLSNSVSARLMEDQPLSTVLLIAVAVVLGAALLNGLVGYIVAVSQIPDIVVTLATLFIFTGLALMVLPSPGGGTHRTLRFLFTGSETGIGVNFWPPLIAIGLGTGLLALFLTRTKPGLAIYAVGSDELAAHLSGVSVLRTKVVAYAVGGGFAGLAGVARTAVAGTGNAAFGNAMGGTLDSLAAVVLGGVLLGGGQGSVVGVAAAGIAFFTLQPILNTLGVGSNTAQVVRGVVIVLVMVIAGLVQYRRWRNQ